MLHTLMCFSVEADLITGIVVTAIGVSALRNVYDDRQRAMAALPVVFGVHQLIEVIVWWGLDGTVGPAIAEAAQWLYLTIAFGLIPWAIPLAVRRLEPDSTRRRWMAPLIGLGTVVAVALMVPTLVGPITVTNMGNHLAYSVPLVWGGELTALYVIATCGALVLSSDPIVAVFGMLNLVAVTTLAILLVTGVISLWCVWAAVSSVAVAIHLRRGRHVDARTPATV